MQYTDPNCPSGTQGASFDTFQQQRNAEDLRAVISTVDKYFEDWGISEPIETLNVLTASLFPNTDGEPQIWSLDFIRDAHSVVSHLNEILTKLYELRRNDLYKKASV